MVPTSTPAAHNRFGRLVFALLGLINPSSHYDLFLKWLVFKVNAGSHINPTSTPQEALGGLKQQFFKEVLADILLWGRFVGLTLVPVLVASWYRSGAHFLHMNDLLKFHLRTPSSSCKQFINCNMPSRSARTGPKAAPRPKPGATPSSRAGPKAAPQPKPKATPSSRAEPKAAPQPKPKATPCSRPPPKGAGRGKGKGKGRQQKLYRNPLKHWCMRISNPGVLDLQHLCHWNLPFGPVPVEACKWTYIIIGWEGVLPPQPRTPHFQIYVEVEPAVHWHQLKSWFHNAHIEPRFGSPQKAADYCKKEHQWRHEGTISSELRGMDGMAKSVEWWQDFRRHIECCDTWKEVLCMDKYAAMVSKSMNWVKTVWQNRPKEGFRA